MSKLKAASRNKLKSSTFGLPGSRKYPMPDRSHAANAKARATPHAANAKARATQMVKRGKLSAASADRIRAKANQVLRHGR